MFMQNHVGRTANHDGRTAITRKGGDIINNNISSASGKRYINTSSSNTD